MSINQYIFLLRNLMTWLKCMGEYACQSVALIMFALWVYDVQLLTKI
jgi:hypothetical protein